MTSQEKKEIFQEFLNKFIKIVYDDFGKPQTAKGILKKIDSNFLYIKGDYSEQVVSVSKILKINYLGGNNDN